MDGETVTVKMAGMEVVSDGRGLKTILGSCVGVILRDAERRVSGLAHIMLPLKQREDMAMGKYADSAVPALFERMVQKGGRPRSLQAWLIGGAQMFPMGNARLASIGDQNVEAARKALKERNIPIVFEDVGGRAGRAVTFDPGTGTVSVRTLQAIEGNGGTP
jgi:chemotaxis protein CheD